MSPDALFLRRPELLKVYRAKMVGGLHLLRDAPEPDSLQSVLDQICSYIERQDFLLSAWWANPEDANGDFDLQAMAEEAKTAPIIMVFYEPCGPHMYQPVLWGSDTGDIKAQAAIRRHRKILTNSDKRRIKIFLPRPDGEPEEPQRPHNETVDGFRRGATLRDAIWR